MKLIFALFILSFSSVSMANSIYYQVESGDQLGRIFLSLGHKKLWSKDGKVNKFKKSSNVKFPNKLKVGSYIKLNDQEIVFKKNITIKNDSLYFKKKIKTIPEYEKLLAEEGITEDQIADQDFPSVEFVNKKTTEKVSPEITAEEFIEEKSIHSFNIYTGIGTFVAYNKENDRGVSTSTFSGLQPLVQIKGIYSSSLFGSLSFDLLTKRLITSEFNFPINFDYRVQLLPKWNISENFLIAISHSFLKHSYVGKSSDLEVAYELKSNFVGLGIVLPRNNYWFELYVEKAYNGETKSNEQTQKAASGIRIDTEFVLPVSTNWRIIPGLNYYQLKDKETDYSFDVVEGRLVLAREFEF